MFSHARRISHPPPAAPDLSDEALAAVTAQLAARAPEYDRTGEIPAASLDVAHRAGLLTATVAARYGGPAVGAVDFARIMIALGEGDASVALLAANNLAVHQAQAAYADLLRRSAAGPALANHLRAEPDLGAPARGGVPATVARRTADGWSLTGRKAYATGGASLAYHVVWAIADEPRAAEPARIGHVVVPADAPGISWVQTWDHLGLRASNTHDALYDGVQLPADAFAEIPREADGTYRDPAAATSAASLAYIALYVGVARAARSAFVAFAHERVPSALGRPIATTESIQAVAGEIDARIAQAETLVYGALLRDREGHGTLDPQLSLLKVQVARSSIAAVEAAVAALGNPALSRRHPFERLLRDVLCVRVHPPQENAALLAAGRRLLLTR